MSTRPFTDFITQVQPYVPGCPRSAMIDAIRRAAIQLCEESLIWREDITAGDLVVDKDDYTITPPAGTRVIVPINVRVDGVPIDPATEEELDALDYNWRASGNKAKPSKYHCPEPNRIKFNRVPDETITAGIVIRVSLKPLPDATSVGDVVFYDWFETIRRGALSFLQQMPEKHWTDKREAARNGQFFKAQIQAARNRADKGHTRKANYVKMRRLV